MWWDSLLAPVDPAGIRALADRLGRAAVEVRSRAHAVESRVGALDFEGPKARRFRDAVGHSNEGARRAAARLDDLVGELYAEAARADVILAEWERTRFEDGTTP